MIAALSTQHFKTHSIDEVLEEIKQAVRKKPDNADLRAQLFQVLALKGDWQRAVDQLKISAEMNQQAQPVAMIYINAINAESERNEVLAGRAMPAVFGTPPDWMALLSQALKEDSREQAAALRQQALEMAPSFGGTLKTHANSEQDIAFQWLCDGDGRLGPILEFMSNGRYGWIPFEDIESVRFIEAQGLSDLLWVQTEVHLLDGRSHVGIVPARYPATVDYASQNDALNLGHRTEWLELSEDIYQGLGQKMFMSDEAEYGLLEIAEIRFNLED